MDDSGHHDPAARRALNEIQKRIVFGRTQDDVFNYVFDSLNEFIPFDRVGVAILDKDHLRSIWVKSRTPVKHLKSGYSAPVAGSSLEVLLRTKRPRIISDLREYLADHRNSVSTELILKDGMRSSLTFPLEMRGEPIGVAFFSSTKPGTFTSSHLKLLESVAQGLSLVLEHTQITKARKDILGNDRFMAKVLHDIHSPLWVIMSFTDMLCESPEFKIANENIKSMFGVLKRNSEMILSLVNSLSDLLESRRVDFTIAKETVRLADYIGNVLGCLRPLATAKNIELVFYSNAELPETCIFDPVRIRQVLQNLVSNAVKFSQPNTKIIIRSWSSGSRLFFAVEDEGQGIPAEDMSKLFREFGVTSVKSTQGEKSTGLGLAICKQIVDASGGEISVQSQVGRGSTFQFWIPLSTDQ